MPRPRSRREVRQETEQKYVGFQWEGNDSLPVVLQRINMVLGILKAALVQPLDPDGTDPIFGDFVIGDYMRQQRNSDEDQDAAWDEYLRTKQNPPGWAEVDNSPSPRIVDVTRDRNDEERRNPTRRSTTRG